MAPEGECNPRRRGMVRLANLDTLGLTLALNVINQCHTLEKRLEGIAWWSINVSNLFLVYDYSVNSL